jgi:chromosome segregation ATPase
MALLAIKDGFQPNDQGDIVLTQDQMKKIDDQLKLQDDACKKAKTLIDSLKDEVKKLKDDITSKDDEIKNLKEGPGERKDGGEVVDDQGLNGAAELWNSIEKAL